MALFFITEQRLQYSAVVFDRYQCNIRYSKLGGTVDSLKGQEGVQKDTDRLEHWEVMSGMKIKSKCQILL